MLQVRPEEGLNFSCTDRFSGPKHAGSHSQNEHDGHDAGLGSVENGYPTKELLDYMGSKNGQFMKRIFLS